MKKIKHKNFISKVLGCCALGVCLLTSGLNAQITGSNNTPGNIPDNSPGTPLVRTIDIAGVPAGPVGEIAIEIAMNHTWAGDLQITLAAPNGVTLDLIDRPGTPPGTFGCSGDFEAQSPITYTDMSANGPMETALCPAVYCTSDGICDYNPDDAFTGYGFADGTEANGTWTLSFADNAGGDLGDFVSATLSIGDAMPPMMTDVCEVVCPTSEEIYLDPGLCEVAYAWSIQTIGGDDLCGTLPTEDFTGPFAEDQVALETNGPNSPAPGPFNGTDCVQYSEEELSICSADPIGGQNNCGFQFTIAGWIVPEDGTITVDWSYSTSDVDPFLDPVGIGVNFFVVDPIAGWLNFGDPLSDSGTSVVSVQAGDRVDFVTGSFDGDLGPMCATFSNFVFTPDNLLSIDLIQGEESGSYLGIGSTDYEVEVTTADGQTVTCSWTVDVFGFDDPTTTLACNDLVNVSVDENCMAFVSADMILEGGSYACYDGYLVAIEGVGENLGGMTVTGEIGNTLTVTVTDTLTGNSCWGEIYIEDKLPPVITMCDTISLFCGQDTDPVVGQAPQEILTPSVTGNFPIDVPPGDNIEFEVEIEVSSTNQYPVQDVDVYLNMTHTWVGDLQVYLTGPNGEEVTLLDQSCNFGFFGDVDVTIDDEGRVPVCAQPDPAIRWRQQSWNAFFPNLNPLSVFDGGLADGTWTLRVVDAFPVLDGGSLNEVQLIITTGLGAATTPIATDNCSDVTLTYEDEESGDECDIVAIERTWTATDASGNTSTCVQIIEIEPLDLAQLVCPENYEGECDDDISPENTGYPTVGGNEITGGFCNIFLDYWDKPLPACGNGSKIIRTWTILDWCTQETVECVQIIKLNSTGPGLLCPDNQVVGADPWTCETDVNLTPPAISEVCGGTAFSLHPEASNGVIVDFGNGNYRVDGLPLGETIITWYAEDECGAEASCSYTITVVDDVPPVALCDEHTIVSLTFDSDLDQGLTKVPAEVFDDGSYDNCTGVTFTAARMSSCIDFDWTTGGACVDEIKDGRVTSTDRGTAFRPCVPFACCDVAAGPIMVVLRVTDEFNNVNECMVEIEVQDKIKPFITCPPDIVVSCDFWFAANETGGFVPTDEDVLTPVFGDVLDAFEYDQEDRQDIIIDDPGNDELPQPYNWGKDGFADDNCDVDITVNVTIQDDCSGDDFTVTPPHPNAVRLITRTFRARDGQGNLSDCRQRIWVVDYDPFYISDETCANLDRNDGVEWPCDEEYDFCPQGGIDPTYPIIYDDNCSLIGVTFEDTRFDFVDGACYKILREWTVIDWCQYDGQGAGIWSYVQVIKVLDNEPTFILGCPINPETKSVLDQGITLPDNNQVFLGEDNPLATSCTVHVTDTFRLSEFCSDEVTYDVKIFPFNGPDFLQIHEKRTVQMDTNGFADAVIDTRSSDILGVRLNGLPYNSNVCSNWPLPGGDKDYHRVLITVEDGCGNVNACEYLLRLEDKKAPSPVCVGLSSVVMPSSGEVTIWAKDFNASSFDDCTPAADLLYSFSGENYEPSRSFTCADLAENGSPSFIVEIYVADKGNDDNCNGFRLPNQNEGITDGIEWAERNKDFCTTFIVIDDNENVCSGTGGSAGGVISTEELEPVEKVNVNLKDHNGNVVTSFTTDKDGIYHFINPLLDLDIEPVRNDDHKNGVSTLDLVKIQKHLLGIEDLGSPYKLIAADANNSSSVSAIDLVELRKLILGLYNELPNNSSWRFADGNYEFADEANPWDFVEVVNIQGLAMDKDFVAIKIGDVNGTVSANSNSIETRNVTGAMKFQAVDQTVAAGEEVLVDVTSSDFTNIIGYQFTLQTAGLKLTDVVAGAIDMGIENVGIHKNSVTASWNRVTAVSAEADDVLFTLAFTATNGGQLSDMLSINSRLTEAEAYDESENILDVAITFTTEEVAQAGKDFALFQNSPNPFNGETVIAFTLPEAMEATLTVFDVTGKVVYLTEGDYAAGYNNVTVSANDLSATGVLYYRLDADDFTATKKMVLID